MEDFIVFLKDKKDEENGLFIDIDIYNDTNNRSFTDRDLKGVLNDFIDILINSIDVLDKGKEIIFHAFIMDRNELNFDDKKNKYKEGYHIIIPDLYLNKSSRKYLLCELKKEYNDIDTATASNPSMLYGCVKPTHLSTRNKYNIKLQKEIIITNKKYKNIVDIEDYILDTTKCNIVKELSLTIEGDILKNNYITLKEEIIKNFPIIFNNDDDNDIIQKVDIKNLEDLKRIDLDANILCELLDILDSKYYDDRDYWWKVLCGIYNESCKHNYKYDIIAEWFSKKSIKYIKSDYQIQWNDIKKRYKNIKTPITLGTIKYYAILSNKDKFLKIIENSDIDMIKKETNKTLGCLQHYTIAKILYNILGKNIYHVPINEYKTTWYVYLDSAEMKIYKENGQLFKWSNEGSNPITLSIYISEELTKRIDKIIKEYDIQIQKMTIQTNESKIDLENLKEKRKQIFKTKESLYNNCFKKNIIQECKNLFYSSYFISKLDQDKKILGVGNGILLLPLNKEEKLEYINDYCNYIFIESYTPVNYIFYDENNYYVKEIYNILKDIIPEEDAFEYIMIFLSTSISNIAKEAIIMFFRGGGSNGKSTIMELMLNTLGNSYSKKLSLGLLTESRETSHTSNSAFMELKNTRFGYFSEPDKVEKINTGRLKEILGNEKLTGRQIYGKQENFENRCNLVAASNYDFQINCNDYGCWRRIKYYEFKVRFVEFPTDNNKYEKKIIKNLISDVIKDSLYREAFLSILIHYYEKYIYIYKADLKNVISKTIQYETDNYKSRQDTIQRFILEKIEIVDQTNKIVLDDLSKKYIQWHLLKFGSTYKSSLDTKEVSAMIENSNLSKYIRVDKSSCDKYFNNILVKEND